MDATCGGNPRNTSLETGLAGDKPRRPATVLEAFANTGKFLRQLGLERIRVIGLSKATSGLHSGLCDEDGVRVVTETEFMRDFVFLSRPCIILDAVEEWPALRRWRDDRYLFDLNHSLPCEPEDDEEEKDGESGDSGTDSEPGCALKAGEGGTAAVVVRASGGEDLTGPHTQKEKRVTVALTPNGRADAVTHVLYDKRDVPEAVRDAVFAGAFAQETMVALRDHPLLGECGGQVPDPNLQAEKIFMYAAEVQVTLPELYKLLLQAPAPAALPSPIYIDMRTYKENLGNSGDALSGQPVVAYAQLQNNCLNTEYKHLRADLLPNIEEFGKRVFGKPVEAANVWLGIPASVSTLHQDWVENLYVVVRGVKVFTLIPPWEGVHVPKPSLPSAPFTLDAGRTDRSRLAFHFEAFPRKDGTLVPWMDLELTPDMVGAGEEATLAVLQECISERGGASVGKAAADNTNSGSVLEHGLHVLHPLFANVHPGETLYLPAMWLHRVEQHADEQDIRARAQHRVQGGEHASCLHKAGAAALREGENPEMLTSPLPLIAAVNYWYDMNYNNPAVVMLQEFGLLL